MKKRLDELLPLCKFYAGGERPPANLNDAQLDFWALERDWVRMMQNGTSDDFDRENQTLYAAHVTPIMPDLHGAPSSLMAYMFVRLSKQAYSLASFAPDFVKKVNKWYK